MRKENEKKKVKVKLPVIAKKNKNTPNIKPLYLHNHYRRQAEILSVHKSSLDLPPLAPLVTGTGYGDI